MTPYPPPGLLGQASALPALLQEPQNLRREGKVPLQGGLGHLPGPSAPPTTQSPDHPTPTIERRMPCQPIPRPQGRGEMPSSPPRPSRRPRGGGVKGRLRRNCSPSSKGHPGHHLLPRTGRKRKEGATGPADSQELSVPCNTGTGLLQSRNRARSMLTPPA